MADEDETTWETTSVRCASCKVEVEAQRYGNTVISVPAGWLVGNPGTDAGPALLCSRPCVERWVAAETASWEASSRSSVAAAER